MIRNWKFDNARMREVISHMIMVHELPFNFVDYDLFNVDGHGEIEGMIHNVRESVKHVNASPSRLHIFSELAKQLSMPKKHLILDVTTRWNATYAMLSTALEFKEVFLNYADRKSTYTTLPSEED
ncbi:hypothetical protein V6N11_052186 [Hibiscus sabdariffa]|uniref:Uncharacterized protein n=1 Tax=Hibiscus sabdariffa TaxID=183260 RepID=A0ABR2UA06_9ROSI